MRVRARDPTGGPGPSRPGSTPTPGDPVLGCGWGAARDGVQGGRLVMNRTDVGRRGEELAARDLVRRGWRILDRNFRWGSKELDLVARKGRILAFVEVKTRRGSGFGHPLEAITRKKRMELESCARAWLRERPPPPGFVRRFDAVAVHLDETGTARIEHVEDAWRVGD